MSRNVQAPDGSSALVLWKAMALVCAGLAATACSVTRALDTAELEPDTTLVTAALPERTPVPAIAAPLQAAFSELTSDPATSLPLSWRDTESGASGSVTYLGPFNERTCRTLVTTYENFEGVSLYRGELCGRHTTGLRIVSFEPQ